MADAHQAPAFPTQDSLCESCGYPIKGLAIEADCPECGLAIAASSPGRRDLDLAGTVSGAGGYVAAIWRCLTQPRRVFRSMPIGPAGSAPERFLFRTTFLAGLVFASAPAAMIGLAWGPLTLFMPFSGFLTFFVAGVIAIACLTQIEALGVTAFSRKRGWRVPYPLARRVCCYASVGWLPGTAIAGGGLALLHTYAAPHPWFDQVLGLVRVSWLCYAGLFLLSLLWFETLVWVGVRQVRYANDWPAGRGDA